MAHVGITATWLPTPSVADVEEYLDYLRWAADEVIARFSGPGDANLTEPGR